MAMMSFNTNNDGVLDANDTNEDGKVDKQDGVTEATELHSLSAVRSINNVWFKKFIYEMAVA